MRRTGSADTALWIAAARARESARADRLFDDPWADTLAGDVGRAILARSADNVFLPVRTRFFDDVVLAAAAWADQVVLLGAGMDTRAWRLGLPDRITVYEIDQPGSLAVKDEVLLTAAAPTCPRLAIEVDLREDWPTALLGAGFDPRAPTVWLAEGLLFYLISSTVDTLLSRAAALSESGALLAADVFGTGLLRMASMAPLIEHNQRTGRPQPYCTDEPTALLRRCGWQDCAITEPGQSRANFGRLPVVPDNWSGGVDPTLRTYLVIASLTR